MAGDSGHSAVATAGSTMRIVLLVAVIVILGAFVLANNQRTEIDFLCQVVEAAITAGATTAPEGWRPTYTNAFGTDPEVWEDASPIDHVEADKGIPRFFVAARGVDWRVEQHLAFIDALRRARLAFIDVGQYDEYQLQVGARLLHRKLDALGIAHVYEEYPDGHRDTHYRYDVSLPRLYEALR